MDSHSPVIAGLVGSLVAGLCTGLGALPIFVRTEWSKRAQNLMLSSAAGMMLCATFFSLLAPAIERVRAHGGSAWFAALTVSLGVVLGALCLWGLHAVVPHEHFEKGREGAARPVSRKWLFVFAIALHNLPEGLSVGVAYGGAAAGAASPFGAFANSGDAASLGLSPGLGLGHVVMLGIAFQNLPEGLAVAAALVGDGFRRGRAFAIALLTGLVEPVGGLIGVTAVSVSEALLPWGLAFAAGAMLFVVLGEVLPETHREGSERAATLAAMAGFVVMMSLALVVEG